MKHLYIKLCLILFVFAGILNNAFAQEPIVPGSPPEGIIYQAEARNNHGALLLNKDLNVRITIWQGSDLGILKWQSVYEITTNDYGMFTLEIGENANQNGYYFENIEWDLNAFFLQVEVNELKKKSIWVNMGTTQLLSVPYALHAKTAEKAIIDEVDDADADPGNELITGAVLNGNDLEITDAGGTNTVDLGSFSSLWTESGSNLYFNTGNIGIGTTTPSRKFEIVAESDNPQIRLTRMDNSDLYAEFRVDPGGNLHVDPTGGVFYLNDDEIHMWKDGNTLTNLFSVNGNSYINGGSVGIGTSEPEEKLHIAGNLLLTSDLRQPTFRMDHTGNATSLGFQLRQAEEIFVIERRQDFNIVNGLMVFDYRNRINSSLLPFEIDNFAGYESTKPLLRLEHINSPTTDYLQIATDETEDGNILTIDPSGNVGIGTTNPAGILDIAGAYHFPSTDGSNGQVFQSDGNGNIQWSDISAGATELNDLIDAQTGNFRTFLGSGAGGNDSDINSKNVGVGFYTLFANTTGENNTATGTHVLQNNITGSQNTANGYASLIYNTEGNHNTAYGARALFRNTTGNGNTAIGSYANFNNKEGSNNTIIGNGAGFGASDNISGNVFIGFEAGYNETNSNRLYMENSNSSTPLIYGEFDNDLLRINGTLDINNAYHFPIIDGSNGQVIQTDGSGALSWVAVANSDFSNGGEAGVADRTLGNSDDYSLGFLTNGISRFNILNDGGLRFEGNLGINTNPDAAASINKSIHLNASKTYSNAILNLSGHNSGTIYLESRRPGFTPETSGKKWTISSGSGSVLDLDKFNIYNPDDGSCFTIRDGGKIGIGTTEPDEKLHINGNLRLNGSFEDKDGDAGSTGQILSSTGIGTEWITASSGGDFSNGGEVGEADRSLGNTDNYAFGFKTNNTSRLYIANSGNIGIGTANPHGKLEVYGSNIAGTTVGDFVVDTDNKKVYVGRLSTTSYDNSDFIIRNRLGFETFVVSGNGNYISLGNYNGANEQMRVVFDGNTFGVGIGTTTPKSKLQVNGGVQIANDTNSAIADKAGTIRYRADSNNSYLEMCM